MTLLRFPERRTLTLGLLSLILFVDEFTYSTIIPVLPSRMAKLGYGETETGLLFGSFGLVVLLAAPLAGKLSSLWGDRRLIQIGLLLLALGAGSYAIDETFTWMSIARTLHGIATAFLSTAALAIVARIYPRNKRGTAMGVLILGMSGGLLVGPVVGGTLVELVGYRAPFLGILAAVTILAVPTLRLLPADRRTASHESMLALVAIPRVRTLALQACAVMAVIALLEPITPLHLERSFELGPQMVGLLFGAVALGHGIASPPAGALSDRLGSSWIISIGMLLLAVSLLGLSACEQLWSTAVALVSVGLFSAMALVPIVPTLADHLEDEGRLDYGLVYGLLNTAFYAGILTGAFLGGVLADLTGFSMAALVTGGGLLVAAIALHRVEKPG